MLLILLFATTVAQEVTREEPVTCSRFDYEYKMLERLVQLEQRLRMLEKLEMTVEYQQEEIERLKQRVQINTVFAEIQLPARQTFTPGEKIIFTHPVVNTENVYNTDFGFFEPPVNGTYSFSTTLCVEGSTWIIIGIMKDNEILNEYIVGNNSWHTCGSSTMVTYVTTKNKIWVKVLRTYNGVVDTSHGISSFTGALLNTNPQ